MQTTLPQFLTVGQRADARRIAVRVRKGRMDRPGVIWLGGFHSDMGGTKAVALDEWAAREGRACVRFDYSGHGESEGAFENGTIGRWLEESLAVFDTFCTRPTILVGSSMGGWISLLLARTLIGQGRIHKLMLIAPAPDFTEKLMWEKFSPEVRQDIEQRGYWLRPSLYDPAPYPITRKLIEDGRNHLLLDAPLAIDCPVHILQGLDDPDVPWTHAHELVTCLATSNVVLTLVKGGDHRLARPEDIALMLRIIAEA